MHTPLSILLKNKGYAMHSIAPAISGYECAEKMTSLSVGALLVMEDDILIGIVSERDFLKKVLSKRLDPSKILVNDIMTRDPLTVTSDTTVGQAMKIITERRFRHLPVMDDGKLIGMISIGDLTKWAMLQQQHEIEALTGYIHGETK